MLIHNKWVPDDYETAITQWIIKMLKEKGIKETHFSRDAGLGKSETDARTFRKIKQGKRHWSIVDLCKVASYFNIDPSLVLSKVEKFYKTQGIVRPGETAEKIIGLGFSQNTESPVLISTWQKKGKTLVLTDCDPEWKKSTRGEFAMIIGMTSREIFPAYPEVTNTLQKALKNQGEASTTVLYRLKTGFEKKILQDDVDEKLVSLKATFVPPDLVVAYTKDSKK